MIFNEKTGEKLFEVLNRDGIARVGEWTGKKKVKTPNLLFITTNRIKPFIDAEIYVSKNEIESKKPYIINKGRDFLSMNFNNENNGEFPNIPQHLIFPLSCEERYEYFKDFQNEKVIIHSNDKQFSKKAELHVIPNSMSLIKNPRKFLDRIIKIKEKVSYQSLIYTPGIGEPNNLALLVYIGIDLFDSLSLIINSRNGFFLSENGKFIAERIDEHPCFCPACQRKNMDFENLLNHNYYTALKEIKTIKQAIKIGKLRELVETRIQTSPELVSILRLFDSKYYDFQEEFLPITRKNQYVDNKNKTHKIQMICTTLESLKRPEVIRFRQRLINRYLKPDFAKILLLLPCSAKKPYSFSKSHKFFRNVIRNCKNPSLVHEVIVTSPLGLVPRELELFYPAQNYDIPVTGYWNLEEKKMIKDQLNHFIKKNKYEVIISHLPDNMDFVDKSILNCINTCLDAPTSDNSLNELGTTLNKNCEPFEKVNKQDRLKDLMTNIAVFQFGEIGKKLIENSEIKGRYPNLKIIRNNQLAMLTKDRGMLSLTIEGAKILAHEKSYCVQIEDFKSKGSIFATGVIDANSEIRIGDDVIVLHKEELRGVGTAFMSYKEMIESNRGIAVKMRHSA